jgi:hypothetical protein
LVVELGSLQAAVFKELVEVEVLAQQALRPQQKLEQMVAPEYYLILLDLIHIVLAAVPAAVALALAQGLGLAALEEQAVAETAEPEKH